MTNKISDAWEAARQERNYRDVNWEHNRDHLYPSPHQYLTEEVAIESVRRTGSEYDRLKQITDSACGLADKEGIALHTEIREERVKDEARLLALHDDYYAKSRNKARDIADAEVSSTKRKLEKASAAYYKALENQNKEYQ